MTTTRTAANVDLTRYRAKGRELLAEAKAAEADRSLFDRDTHRMAELFGGMEWILCRLLDELDSRDKRDAARRNSRRAGAR